MDKDRIDKLEKRVVELEKAIQSILQPKIEPMCCKFCKKPYSECDCDACMSCGELDCNGNCYGWNRF